MFYTSIRTRSGLIWDLKAALKAESRRSKVFEKKSARRSSAARTMATVNVRNGNPSIHVLAEI